MRQVIKEVALAALAGTIIFEVGEEIDDIDPNLPHNFMSIVSLDALDGSPALPTAGTYTSYVEMVEGGGFEDLSDGGTINASATGGTAGADGSIESGSFSGNPNRIKIVAAAVDVAVAFRVVIQQNAA